MAPAGDTIVALSSGRPPAAIAVVRTSGPSAFAAAERIGGSLPPARKGVLRSLTDPSDGSLIDQAIVLRFDAPASSTGENIVEYQCHGGRATVDALIRALLEEPGMRLAQPGEFTRRALANGRIDLTEAEGLADLLSAETELQRRSAMARAGGAFRTRLEGWRNDLLALSAQAEVVIDYADEGGEVPDLGPGLTQLAQEMSTLLDAPRVEPLRDGIRVVVAGPPNAGKSSLVNALARNERAIVTPIPGTTRDIIEVPLSIGGVPFVLVDTAGLRDSSDEVESIGIDLARQELERADILLWLGVSSAAPDHPVVVRLAAKADLPQHDPSSFDLAISSKTGQGIARLLELLADRARELLPKGDELALDRRQHDLLQTACSALERGAALPDPVLIAEELRIARSSIDRISGRTGVENLLDALFGRFCLGK
jgi:tRNA modification GTPase